VSYTDLQIKQHTAAKERDDLAASLHGAGVSAQLTRDRNTGMTSLVIRLSTLAGKRLRRALAAALDHERFKPFPGVLLWHEGRGELVKVERCAHAFFVVTSRRRVWEPPFKASANELRAAAHHEIMRFPSGGYELAPPDSVKEAASE
jgi:hypothetical protein